jgi:hypothetical protein
VRVEHVIHVGEHVSDMVVPVLHGFVAGKVFHRQVVEVGFQIQVLCLLILGVFDPLSGRAEPCVGEHQRNDTLQKIILFPNRSLVDGVQLGHKLPNARRATSNIASPIPEIASPEISSVFITMNIFVLLDEVLPLAAGPGVS